jgi:transcriptional regulator with XRE-family HTH domain
MTASLAGRKGRGRAKEPLDRERMGERLRTIRKARGLTLKALSERSGVALSTLSKIELGQISVSYEKLAAVARGLAVDIAALFDPRAAAHAGTEQPTVVRSTPATAPRYDGDNYDYRMLATEFPGKRMTPLHGTIVARDLAQFPDYIRHAGQEFVMVLSGRVCIRFETGESIELGRQESAYFDSGIGHVYLSTGKTDAQVVVVMSER